MTPYQEPKYEIRVGGISESGEELKPRLVNRQTGEAIPGDEPIFILRARDPKAVRTLIAYNRIGVQGGDVKDHQAHSLAVEKRIEQFTNWATAHPKRMKNPDTNMDENWSTSGKP